MVFGKRLIRFLQRKQVGESSQVKKGLPGEEKSKTGYTDYGRDHHHSGDYHPHLLLLADLTTVYVQLDVD
jgi:hypothetical protein